MIPIALRKVADIVGGRLHPESDSSFSVTNVFTDSREATDGGLFVCIRGANTDGHRYAESVLSKGCAALIGDENCFRPNTILVQNPAQALFELAAYYRREMIASVRVVAVTGSVGKTTTKDMIGLVLRTQYPTFVTPGNRNSLIGVPLSVLAIDAKVQYAVLELGMSEPGEISRLSHLVCPDLSVITLVGNAHIEAFGTVENIRREKFSILDGMKQDARIILNADNPPSVQLSDSLGSRAFWCSADGNRADLAAEEITQTENGMTFKVAGVSVHLALDGKHAVSDALSAVAVGLLCGIPSSASAKALEVFQPQGNRQRVLHLRDATIIADCYNASPESMKAALEVLAKAEGRRIAVLGDMYELGSKAAELHTEIAQCAMQCADILVFIGDYRGIYAEACTEAGRACKVFPAGEKDEASDYLRKILRKGDTVLLKASHRLALEQLLENL